jgi:NAD(P)-dependent dehydrogenase (short-subunit alcohol dehydrogenase family)
MEYLMTYTYLITGANRGIGLEMSRGVVAAGDRLIAVCRQPGKANELNALIETSNGEGVVYGADACDEAALNAIAEQVKGAIDVVVCNAGVISARGGIEDSDNNATAISQVLMTNTAGPFFTARAFLRHLKASKHPRIAIISSYMGSQQHGGTSAHFYRASKAGANNLMVTLANELKSSGITVASFHPGWVRTDMGGAGADISAQESAAALLNRFRGLTLKQSGAFLNYDGKPLPL